MRSAAAPVLVVETMGRSRALYADILPLAGYQVTVVADSERAFIAAIDQHPRAVIVSFEPQIRDERRALCQRLRDDARTRSLPIVLVASTLEPSDIQWATEAGVLAVVADPGDSAKLVGALEGVLAGRRAERIKATLREPNNRKRFA